MIFSGQDLVSMDFIELNEPNDSSLKKKYGLTKSRETELIEKIEATNLELEKAGKSILQVAKLLSQVKNLVRNKNWVELTDSGALVVPGRVARDLASAYENWLGNSSIPEAALTQVSARTLARIGKVEPSLRVKIEKHLNLEKKYTESDLSFFLRKPRSTKQTIDELIEKAKLSADNMNDEEKIENFKNLFIENIQLKKKIRVLEEQLFKYKFQLNKSSLQV